MGSSEEQERKPEAGPGNQERILEFCIDPAGSQGIWYFKVQELYLSLL